MDREVFSESEKRFLITQILQASSVPLERIFMLFGECNEEPRWENIYLPTGRTLQECKAAFEEIRSNSSPFATPDSPGFMRAPFHKRKVGMGGVESSSPLSLESKRRLSGIRGQDMGGQQLILPKPSPTESIMSGSEGMFGQQLILPKPMSMDSSSSVSEVMVGHQHILPKPSPTMDSGLSAPEVTVKKRGRPPKAEVERRQQALARGDLNNPQTMITQIRHMAPDASGQASSSSPKSGNIIKRSGPVRQPGEGRFSLNDYVKPIDRKSPNKSKKLASTAATPAGPESSTTKTTSKAASSPQTPVSNVQPTESQISGVLPRKLDKESSEGSPSQP